MRTTLFALGIAASVGLTVWFLSARTPEPATAAPAAPVSAAADQLPPNWPWRAVMLDMHTGDAEDVADIAVNLGAGAVRIDLVPRLTMTKYGCTAQKAWEVNLAAAGRALDACKEFGLTGIICYSQYPEDPNAGYRQDSERFWESKADRDGFMRNVRMIIDRFKGRGDELGGYYFMIEPLEMVDGKPMIPPAWPAMASDIVSTVRQKDGNRWVVINPGPGGLIGGFKTLEPLDDPYIVYSTHMYIPFAFTHQGANSETSDFTTYSYPGRVKVESWGRDALDRYLRPAVDFQRRTGRPVWIGEFSAIRWAPGCVEYIDDCIDVFQSHGFGWCFLSYNGYHGWNLHYDDRFSPGAERAFTLSHGPSDRWKLLEKRLGEPYPATRE